MRILSWNCRDLGGPSTISQLKESLRTNLLDLIVYVRLSKLNQFIKTVCKNLKYGQRWDTVEPVSKSGGNSMESGY